MDKDPKKLRACTMHTQGRLLRTERSAPAKAMRWDCWRLGGRSKEDLLEQMSEGREQERSSEMERGPSDVGSCQSL